MALRSDVLTCSCYLPSLSSRTSVLQTGTDYGPYLINEAPPLHTTAIVDACTRRLADVWSTMRANADSPLSTFLDFCTYGHMIDNVVLIVTGLTHERDVQVSYISRVPAQPSLICTPAVHSFAELP